MSEEEKRKRDLYKKNRDKWIRIQAVLIAAITLLAIVLGVVYYRANQTYYINYEENGAVDYRVYLFENDFFEDEYLGKDQAYIASLIDDVKADFSYTLDMEADNVDYEYSYEVDTVLEIIDKNTGFPIQTLNYVSVPQKTLKQNSSKKLVINEAASIDYDYYNRYAISFIDEHSLDHGQTECRLAVTMRINVVSISDDFAEESKNEYAVALNIPLASKTLDIKITSTVPETENKILACERALAKDVFKFATVFMTSLDAILIALFVVFIFSTRNRDINYTIKVQKLVSAYKSFIQKITNEFDTSGYQELSVNTFNEMLEIRDTISSPILMSENEDKTCTKFIIPTNTKLLYVFDIKVEGYDEIYGSNDENVFYPEEAPVNEDAIPVDVPVTEEAVVEEAVAETLQSAVEEAKIEETTVVEETVVEETSAEVTETVNEEIPEETVGYISGVKYDYSFEAKLSLATSETKDYYRELASFIKSHGVKISRSWKRERVYLSGNQFACLLFKGSKLAIALALDPKEYADTKYNPVDLSGMKKYEKTPMLLKISSQRKLKYATELLTVLFAKEGIEDKKISSKEKSIPTKTKQALMKAGLIRKK